MNTPKRIIDYTLSSQTRLSDLREIVAETQTLRGDSEVEFPRFVGQGGTADYNHIVITEHSQID
jgi:hypothetical protein